MNKIAEQAAKYRATHPWASSLMNARTRCNNPKASNYHRYGGRGIKCFLTQEEVRLLWDRDEAASLKWASLDRIDGDGDYTLSNCRFVEHSENSGKRSNAVPYKTGKCFRGHDLTKVRIYISTNCRTGRKYPNCAECRNLAQRGRWPRYSKRKNNCTPPAANDTPKEKNP